MPFINIKTLEFEQSFDVRAAIIKINDDFASKNDISLNHVHTTWELLNKGHYAKGNIAPDFQPEKNHPIIVDLLTPDFNDIEKSKLMLKVLATSISERLGFPINNIFINHRQALSEMVFDDGEVVSW